MAGDDDRLRELVGHADFLRQDRHADFLDVEHADEAEGAHLVEHAVLEAREAIERLLDGEEVLLELRRRQDVDVPAGEARREAHVLAATADGERELVLAHDDRATTELEAQADFLDLGRLQRVGDEHLARLVPADDVDLLAAELIDDVADAAAAHADARAHRVDLGVDAGDGKLGAEAGLAAHGLDLDDALGHLGHLGLEKLADEVRVRTGQHDLDLAGGVADVEDQAANAVAGLELLAGNLLAAGHEALDAVHLDHEGAALVARGGAGDQLALALAELLEEAVALVLAELLDHHLLGGLRRDAAERLQVDGLAAAFLELAPERDAARQPVDLAAELLGVEGVEVLARGADHGLLQVVEKQFTVDVAVAGDRVEDGEGFTVHGAVLRWMWCWMSRQIVRNG